MARSRFPAIRNHVLLRWASAIEEADSRLRPELNGGIFERILDAVPDAWLPLAGRAAYVEYFVRRLSHADQFVEEAIRARAELV